MTYRVAVLCFLLIGKYEESDLLQSPIYTFFTSSFSFGGYRSTPIKSWLCNVQNYFEPIGLHFVVLNEETRLVLEVDTSLGGG